MSTSDTRTNEGRRMARTEVTFRRLRNGQEHRARFELGSDTANARCAVEHAWNTNSEIVEVRNAE